MRELKYRMQLELIADSFGTCKKGDIEMFYFNLLEDKIGLAKLPISDKWKIVSCDQYTGLKDKNGVEIYEGDQLHICAGYSSTVEFQDGMFVSIYKHPEDGEIIPLIDAIGENTIIIGNIHQISYK